MSEQQSEQQTITYFYNNPTNRYEIDKNDFIKVISKNDIMKTSTYFKVKPVYLNNDIDIEDIIHQKRLQIIKSQKMFGFTNNKEKARLLSGHNKVVSNELIVEDEHNADEDNADEDNDRNILEKPNKYSLETYSYALIGHKQISKLKFEEGDLIGVYNNYCKISVISNIQGLLSVFDRAFAQYFGKVEPKKLFVEKIRESMPSLMYSKNDIGILVLRQNIMQNQRLLKYMLLYAKAATKKVIIVITGIGTSNTRNRTVNKSEPSVCDKGAYDMIFNKYLNEKQKDKILLMTCNNSLAKNQLRLLVNIILQKDSLFYLDYNGLNRYAEHIS